MRPVGRDRRSVPKLSDLRPGTLRPERIDVTVFCSAQAGAATRTGSGCFLCGGRPHLKRDCPSNTVGAPGGRPGTGANAALTDVRDEQKGPWRDRDVGYPLSGVLRPRSPKSRQPRAARREGPASLLSTTRRLRAGSVWRPGSRRSRSRDGRYDRDEAAGGE
ncbi:hypothetical protein FA95DRAFT_78807 [Auriscalpium vulgare]|uniref:Uncharacterized protein n=1 Tax=Auriscalpium vulgare TaxID=40419 RepID=A0ACB8RPN6_9AGAM|nr:hypothetical protein FA95DRAFT_78807 [Auriscalpium vulgare]